VSIVKELTTAILYFSPANRRKEKKRRTNLKETKGIHPMTEQSASQYNAAAQIRKPKRSAIKKQRKNISMKKGERWKYDSNENDDRWVGRGKRIGCWALLKGSRRVGRRRRRLARRSTIQRDPARITRLDMNPAARFYGAKM